jgi:hypothetical protein
VSSRNGTAAKSLPVTLATLADGKRLPLDFLRQFGLQDVRRGGISIPYCDVTGEALFVRKRDVPGLPRFWQPAGVRLQPYGQWRLHEAQQARLVVLVEGESDSWALWYHGFPALGIPGANAAGVLEKEHLDSLDEIYICREPGTSGETFVSGVQKQLKKLGFAGRVYELRMPGGIKDPADLHADDPEAFLRRFQEAVQAARPLDLAEPSAQAKEPLLAGTEEAPWQPPLPLGEVPEADPFPADVFPGPLQEFVEQTAAALNCPADYVGVPMVAVAGAAIGATRCLEVKPGWQERPGVYAAVIGPPGSAKSPALRAVAAPVYAEQARRLASYRRTKVQWEEGGENGQPPKLDTVFIADVTVEKLAGVLADNPRGVVLVRDELTAWIGGMDQYRAKGRGGDRQFYLSCWAGEAVRVDRKSEAEPVFVSHPFVGVIGGLPPDLLPRLRGEHEIQDGFVDRLLLAYPTAPPAVRETWACVRDDTAAAWADALRRLWNLEQEAGLDGGTRPRYVRLTGCGRAAWERFTEFVADQLNRGDLPDAIKGHAAKFRGYGARLALIIHLLRVVCGEADHEDVSGASMGRAEALVRYFFSHALKAHAAMGSDAKVADAIRLWKWVLSQDVKQFSRRDAYRSLRGRIKTVDDVDPVLEVLAKHAYIRPAKGDRTGPGRKPSETFDINPLALAAEAGQGGTS